MYVYVNGCVGVGLIHHRFTRRIGGSFELQLHDELIVFKRMFLQLIDVYWTLGNLYLLKLLLSCLFLLLLHFVKAFFEHFIKRLLPIFLDLFDFELDHLKLLLLLLLLLLHLLKSFLHFLPPELLKLLPALFLKLPIFRIFVPFTLLQLNGSFSGHGLLCAPNIVFLSEAVEDGT